MKLTYDEQGFIVGTKKAQELGQKTHQDTQKIVALLSMGERLNRKEKGLRVKTRQNKKRPTIAQTQGKITGNSGKNLPKTKQGSFAKQAQLKAQNQKIKTALDRHARQIMPKQKPSKPIAKLTPPTPQTPKAETRHDKQTLKLLDRFNKSKTGKTGLFGGLLGGVLGLLPFGRLLKGGKWLLRGLKRFPILAGMIGGLSLFANWGNLTRLQKSQGVGGLVGSVGGMVAGAMIGQALIPIPIVGALVGGIVGEKIGNFLGTSAGGGIYQIATGAFGEWVKSLNPTGLIDGLKSLWTLGIAPLIKGANDTLTWFKDKLMAVGESLKNAHQKAVDWTSDKIEKLANFFGRQPNNYVPPDVAMKVAQHAYNNARDKLLGACALFVNNAFRAIGYNAGGHGYQVADNLYKKNKGKFEYVKFDENYVPQIGDVMSFTAGNRVGARQRAKYKGKTFGHTQIYTEHGWVSDGKQKSMWAGQDYKADYADGSSKIIVVRPTGGKYTTQAPTQAKTQQTSGAIHEQAYNATGIKYYKIGTINENELVLRGNQKINQMAAPDYDRMASDFKKATGKSLTVQSGYRSTSYQQGIIDRKKKAGQSDKQIYSVSAPAGYSEHQTGLAMDFSIGGSTNMTNDGVWSDNSIGYQWLKANAHKYGFRQTYQKGNAQGVNQENWHWAWVGNDRAKQLVDGNRPTNAKVATAQPPQSSVNTALAVPSQNKAIPPTPTTPTKKQTGKTTTVAVQGNKAKDRDPIHAVKK